MTSRTQRAYQACLYCRRRKSKCEFDTSMPGWSENNPQCRRCTREGRRCILDPKHGSHRKSGRSASVTSERDRTVFSSYSPILEDPKTPSGVDQSPSSPGPAWEFSGSRHDRTASSLDRDLSPTDRTIVDGDLQNPGDALSLLARVANDRDPGLDDSVGAQHNDAVLNSSPIRLSEEQLSASMPGDGYTGDDTNQKLQDLDVSISIASTLLARYRQNFHPFFPIANDEVLDVNKILEMSRRERHLQTAILTIASKQDEELREVHQKCLKAMVDLIASAVFTGPTGVEAVEALLLLAEWAPQHEQWQSNVGAGEEDRAAWMQVGFAVRLAYLQGLDATSFEIPGNNETQASKRRRIAWAACYMSDRLISTRIGKAFWSRGPGPSSVMGFENYGPFKLRSLGCDDYSLIFQANLDLTQLFSNAHDILYASLPHRDRLFKTGEYAKYIIEDDFRNSLANWHAKWSSLSCSANIKCGLLLSYEYLRLYITAFAFQATLSRLPSVSAGGERLSSSSRASFLAKRIAGTNDARFIYEATSAAKSLLSTFNSFVHPKDCLRFMPIRYYLYIIYAAVFLYKAKATGVLRSEHSDSELENMIYQTITRLKDSGKQRKDPGNRYAKLLALLWGTRMENTRASPKRLNGLRKSASETTRPSTLAMTTDAQPDMTSRIPFQPSSDTSTGIDRLDVPMQPELPYLDGQYGESLNSNAFSWRDLASVGQYATSRIDQAGTFAWPELLENAEWNDLHDTNGTSSMFADMDMRGQTHNPF